MADAKVKIISIFSKIFPQMKKASVILLSIALLAVCCGGPKGKRASVQDRMFPVVSVPAAYTEEADQIAYAAAHYWEGYLSEGGPTDSAHLLGVPKAEVEQALSNYITLLWQLPLPTAQQDVAGLFEAVSAVQQKDTASQFYTQFAQTAAYYFYDPNSPMRDEDLWLPFVAGLAESPLTRDDMRTAYRYEASMCALCPRGSVAPNISAQRPDGSRFTLHGIKAPLTLLFFTNPGCNACKEIIDQINMNLAGLVNEGVLAVANIYIDEDYAAWKAYVGNYPSEWHTGFDYAGKVRGEHIYDVRAIPSVYLLDSEKRIILKDAPFERVLQTLSLQGLI